MIALLSACAPVADEDGDESGAPSTASEALVRQSPIAPGDANCANGGVLFEEGTDADRDAVLDEEEVATSRVVCARETGAQRVVFVSSKTYNGEEVETTDAADARCQALADAVPALEAKRFRAFLLRGTAVPEGFTTDGSFARVDGKIVGDDLPSMLRDGRHWFRPDEAVLLAPISLDETGRKVADFVRTELQGEKCSDDPVKQKSVNDQIVDTVTQRPFQRVGRSDAVDNDWLDSTGVRCSALARIYCVEQ